MGYPPGRGRRGQLMKIGLGKVQDSGILGAIGEEKTSTNVEL